MTIELSDKEFVFILLLWSFIVFIGGLVSWYYIPYKARIAKPQETWQCTEWKNETEICIQKILEGEIKRICIPCNESSGECYSDFQFFNKYFPQNTWYNWVEVCIKEGKNCEEKIAIYSGKYPDVNKIIGYEYHYVGYCKKYGLDEFNNCELVCKEYRDVK